jgi:hypothetical protein
VYRNAAVVGATLHGALLINTNHIMAVGKKSFVLYSDLLVSIEHLTNEEKGILFNHLLEYVNDKNPVLTDRLLITAWKPIEMQLKRDLKKFEEIKVKRSEAGKKSAEIKAQQNSTNSTLVESVQHPSTNSTDNVNDNDTVNDNVNDIKKETNPLQDFDYNLEKCLEAINKSFGKNYRSINDANKKKYKALLKQYKWIDVVNAIKGVKADSFHIEKKYKYATPEFFSRPTTIDKYGFTSEAKPEYQGEDAKLVNYVANYYKS